MVHKLMFWIAAAIVAATLLPTSAGAAPYRVVRWHGMEFCQVWNYALGAPAGWYDVLSIPSATFHEARRTQHWLWHTGFCPNR
jgi:hypothetical protein